jgi:tetratricopeptide (TPR) repeat protein
MLSSILLERSITLAEKQPSSLDYVSLLHELTLKKWMEAMIQNEWRRADTAAQKLSASQEKFWRWLGSLSSALTDICQGKADRAIGALWAAQKTYPEASHLVASAQIMTSHVLMEMGRAEAAEAAARDAMESARQSPLASEALFFYGQSRLMQGKVAEARRIAEDLSGTSSSQRTRTRYEQLLGQIALAESEPDAGVRAMETADSLIEAESAIASSLSPHVQFALASAYSRAEKPSQAIGTLEKLVRDKGAKLSWPIPYVRSFFLLGREYRSQGKHHEAQRCFQQFLRYWGDGELDRQQVEEASQNQ